MRTRWRIALGAALLLIPSTGAQAQGTYGGGYSFKDEPLMSVNRSYLGYSNFVYYGPHAPSPYARGYAAAPAPVPVPAQARAYVAAPAPTIYATAPARRGFRLFGWRRGYRY